MHDAGNCIEGVFRIPGDTDSVNQVSPHLAAEACVGVWLVVWPCVWMHGWVYEIAFCMRDRITHLRTSLHSHNHTHDLHGHIHASWNRYEYASSSNRTYKLRNHPPNPAYTLACSSVYICIHTHLYRHIHHVHPSTRDRPQEAPFSKIGTDAAAVHVAATCFKVPSRHVIGSLHFWHS